MLFNTSLYSHVLGTLLGFPHISLYLSLASLWGIGVNEGTGLLELEILLTALFSYSALPLSGLAGFIFSALGFQKVSRPSHWCRIGLCKCCRIGDLLSCASLFSCGPVVAQLFLLDSSSWGRNYTCFGFDVFPHIFLTGDLNCNFVAWQCHTDRKSKRQEGEEGRIVPTKQNP